MIITPLCQRIIVRYSRKPIWYPTAPSKLFRISPNNFYNEDEIKQIKILTYSYRCQFNSIQEFMKHEFYIPAKQTGGLPKEFIEKEEELDKILYEENDRENARIQKLKDEMFSNRIKELEEKLIEEKLAREDKLINATQMADDFVKEHKDKSDTFVTPDNLEIMIEKAMKNPVSFEFCIDKSGRRYK